MNLNIKRIKISQINQEVNQTFKSGDEIVFLGKATITEARFKDNFDGTHNATYIAKPEITDIRSSEISVTDDKSLKKKSRSQALRQKAFIVAQETGLSEEGLYQSAIDEANKYLDNKLDEEKIDSLKGY